MIKSSLCNVCICGKEAKQVIKFIQLSCGFSYVNIAVYTTSIFVLKFPLNIILTNCSCGV